ncbi:MAG: Inosose isomerase [Verrucomicrobiota bacterium]
MFPFGACLNASTLRGTPVLRQIAAASGAGFGAIELWFADIDTHVQSGGSLAEVRRALEDAGLSVPTVIYLGGWFESPEAEWPRIRGECVRRLEQAAVLGAAHVIAGPPAGVADPLRGAERYHELLVLGGSIGVLPAFEFLGFVEQYCTIESALDVLALTDHSRATTILDPFHIFRGGGSLESVAKLRGKQIAISHFNDTPPLRPRGEQHDADRVWPGDGHLDLHRYLTLLEQTGYRGWLSLELFREDLWRRDPFEVARIGREKMHPFVDPPGIQ